MEHALKILAIVAAVALMAFPFFLDYFLNKEDEEKKISYKRFRIVVFTLVYIIAMTVTLYLLKDVLADIQNWQWVQSLAKKLALTNREIYLTEIITALVVNVVLGFGFVVLAQLVRVGLKKKDLVNPKGKDGGYNWTQRAERAVIRFFHNETWFFVGHILKVLCILLSAIYALMFAVYLIPAMYNVDWLPYQYVSALFNAGYRYPVITLLMLWQMHFFLRGMERLEEECPALCDDRAEEMAATAVDIQAIDEEVRKQFQDYYACDLDLSQLLQDSLASTDHHEITRFIAQAVENDKRNPQRNKEVYLDCLDRMIRSEHSILVNGGFFSEFSMYFLRYLSATIARGDNVVFVCNTDAQIDAVYGYLKEGLAQLSSLYCKDFADSAVDFDDPIWRIVKVSGDRDVLEESSVDDNSILVTSLSYLCSTDFESEHTRFVHLLDTVVFVDTLDTVNSYNRQMAMLNTRLKNITKNNAKMSKNGSINESFRVRYMSRQVRYICFDDTRAPGLDKVLKNMLSVDFESVDAMRYNPQTVVRCYNYEGRKDENGRRSCPQFLSSDEEIGAVMNMAVLCLAKGASNVSVFADRSIPYENLAETITSHIGQVSIKADGSNIRLNKQFYNPDDYSVIIAVDSGDNLPAALRRYMAMVADKPALVIVFSRPYMLRDYFVDNIDRLWSGSQLTRIPVEEGTKMDIAQKILVKANAGGISEEEILRLAAEVAQFETYVKERDINAILRAILELYGEAQQDRLSIYRYFEYTSTRDFDENGIYRSEDRVMLRRQGKLFDLIDGRNMVILSTGERDMVLPVPKERITQNFIAGQNMVHNGNIYYIQKVDAASGRLYARLAVAGKNEEAYQYVQAREYHIEADDNQIEHLFPTKHVVLKRGEGDVRVDDVYVSVFRAPMEVVTKGYYAVDPHTMAINESGDYQSIADPGNDILSRQTYRRYGQLSKPAYSFEDLARKTGFVSSSKGATMMAVRICGQFGPDVNRTMNLAAAMLNELLHAMFSSVADSVAVCPVLHADFEDEQSRQVLLRQPHVRISGQHELFGETDFELLIIEDCQTDLGVVSVLMSAGDDVLSTLFAPIYQYLTWYSKAEEPSNYLYFGQEQEPACFDFASLQDLAKTLGDDKHDISFVDIESVVEYEVCDFCGKRYPKGQHVTELEDGRKMCKICAGNLVGNNKKVLKSHLDRAKIFLESTYGITLDEDYEFCFESTVKIANMLRQNRHLAGRGADAPGKAYVDDNRKVHVEYSLPSVNLSELLVRELTHVWQMKHLPELQEDLAEGHLALVTVQYLRFLNQSALAGVRTRYYESNKLISGEGYRKLVGLLMENPQYGNNPFRYLLEMSGVSVEDTVTPPMPKIGENGDFGKPYTPEPFDRALDGRIRYFHYARLTATHQDVYNTMLDAIQAHAPTVIVEGCSFEEVCKVMEAIQFDHPELFYFNTISMRDTEVILHYGATAEEAELLQRRIDEVVPKYLEGIEESMGAYDAAIRIHAALINSVDYDTIALNRQMQQGGPKQNQIDELRTICGVFLNGKAVCEGYARAMQYLLQKCGVECAEMAGYIQKDNGERGEGHAWNIVKIDGDYYYLDCTWDDSSNTIQTVKNTYLGFNYFCITTEELLRTRDLSMCPTDAPDCSAVRANYYTHNELVLDSYDLGKIKAIAQAAATAKSGSFTFKCASKAVYEEALDRLCASGEDCGEVLKVASRQDKRILTTGYGYIPNQHIRTITVTFRYK